MRNIHLNLARATIIASGISAAMACQNLRAQAQSNTSDVIYELKDVSSPPKPVRMPNPEYCDKARKKRIAGTVLLEMTVAPDGSVHDVRVTQSLFPCLDSQAIAAVSTWQFEPAVKDGKPVAVHLKTEVGFHLY
jgi:TonB family protein